jgi:hypothetical protein
MMFLGLMTLLSLLGYGVARAWRVWRAPRPQVATVRVRVQRWR